jgi:aryl-alcohol dehydrogenase-like predicted oxidoreductase
MATFTTHDPTTTVNNGEGGLVPTMHSIDQPRTLPAYPSPVVMECSDVNIYYGDFRAVTDVTMAFAKNEITALIGPSGCGKSTLLRSLNRMNDLIPQARKQRLNVMAYTPIEPSRILKDPTLARIAERHQATPVQIALAWVTRQEGVMAIPRTGSPKHVKENAAAADIRLAPQDLQEIDRAFPPPARKTSLEMI